MNAVAGGPGSIPAGEHLLWRGGPDPDRMARRWLSTYLRGAVGQLVGLALFLFIARAALAGLGNQRG